MKTEQQMNKYRIEIHGNDGFRYEQFVDSNAFVFAFEHACQSLESLQKTTIEKLTIHTIEQTNEN